MIILDTNIILPKKTILMKLFLVKMIMLTMKEWKL